MNFSLSIDFSSFIEPIRPYFVPLGILVVLLSILMFLGLSAVYKKFGKPAFGAWVPFYNLYLLFDILYQNGWKMLLLLIPVYNVFLFLSIPFHISKLFGHGFFFGIYLLLFPFAGYPILGFEENTVFIEQEEKSKDNVLSSESVNCQDFISSLEMPDLDLSLFEDTNPTDSKINLNQPSSIPLKESTDIRKRRDGIEATKNSGIPVADFSSESSVQDAIVFADDVLKKTQGKESSLYLSNPTNLQENFKDSSSSFQDEVSNLDQFSNILENELSMVNSVLDSSDLSKRSDYSYSSVDEVRDQHSSNVSSSPSVPVAEETFAILANELSSLNSILSSSK